MIIVYSKNNCPQCVLTKNYLDNMAVEYEERNIEEKEQWKAECLDMGYMQVPVIVKDFPKDSLHGRVRESMSGFNPEALDKLINSFE